MKTMKKLILPTILVLFTLVFGLSMNNQKATQTQQDVLDPDFLKNELRASVMEFIEDIGADPDTCYIPFSED